MSWSRSTEPQDQLVAGLRATVRRSVVGRPYTGQDLPEVEIALPRSTERIARHEVFNADEAAALFEVFYGADTIGDGYTLRPVEGYVADKRALLGAAHRNLEGE